MKKEIDQTVASLFILDKNSDKKNDSNSLIKYKTLLKDLIFMLEEVKIF